MHYILYLPTTLNELGVTLEAKGVFELSYKRT